jgi:hypothetical protein
VTRWRFFVLDEDDRILQVSEEYHETMGKYLGCSVWEFLPRAEQVLRPHFGEARSTGAVVERTVFYAGGTVDLRIVPSGGSLTVHVSGRTQLDVRTLGTLAASLRKIEAELAARAPAQHDRRARESLRALL